MIDNDTPSRPADAPPDDPFATAQICKDILDALPVPIIGTGVEGDVRYWSPEAGRVWGRSSREVMGKRLWALGLPGLIGDLLLEKTNAVREGRAERETTDGMISVPGRNESMVVSVEVSPLHDNATKQIVGLLYAVHDVTGLRTLEREMRHVNADLKIANERLQIANEELQAANEELETTNEELQSANEELQTTNEELQSANEELETTNEELQSTNVELDATNRELAHRTEELNLLGFYQRTIIRSLSAAVVVLNDEARITHWNIAAERLLGLAEAEALGQTFWTLRIPAIRRDVTVRIRKALREGRAFRDDEIAYDLPTGGRGLANIAALPLLEGRNNMGAVIIFEDMTRFVKAAERRVREKVTGAASDDAPEARSKRKGKAIDGDRPKAGGSAKAKVKAKGKASARSVSREAALGSRRAPTQSGANGSPPGGQGDRSEAPEKASS